MRSSDPFRGVMMLIAAAVAAWRGFHIHHGPMRPAAFALAAVALAMAVWHFTRRPSQPRT